MRLEDRADGGFTLVEVLVALVVTSFLLVIVLDGSVMARSRLRAADDKHLAIMVASGVLQTAAAFPFQPQKRNGVTDGLAWEVTETLQSTDRRGVLALVQVEARVGGAANRPIYVARVLRIKAIERQ